MAIAQGAWLVTFLADNIVEANIGNLAQAIANELPTTPANWVVIDTFGLSSAQQTLLLEEMTNRGVTDVSRIIFQ